MQMTLETLRNLPAFAAMLADAEREALDTRQSEIDAWHAADERARREIAELEATERKHTRDADKLAAELQAAIEKRDASRIELLRVANRHHHTRVSTTARIAAGADTRLLHFAGWLTRAANAASYASHTATMEGFSRQPRQHIAAEHARRVNALCDKATERVDAMRLEAIGTADMLAELNAMADEIRAAFAPLAPHAIGGLPADHIGQA